jgi:hypothetical protein
MVNQPFSSFLSRSSGGIGAVLVDLTDGGIGGDASDGGGWLVAEKERTSWKELYTPSTTDMNMSSMMDNQHCEAND